MLPLFLLSCVVWSSSRIFSATDHGTNTFQNTHCWGGVRVANACKCDQEAKEGVSRAQSKIASGNKQLGETEAQAAWKDVYIYINQNICTEHLEWDCREDPPVLDVRFVWECGTSWISYIRIHVHWALQVACGSRCLIYLAIRGLYLMKKSQKSYTCTVPMSVKYWQISFQEVWCYE